MCLSYAFTPEHSTPDGVPFLRAFTHLLVDLTFGNTCWSPLQPAFLAGHGTITADVDPQTLQVFTASHFRSSHFTRTRVDGAPSAEK